MLFRSTKYHAKYIVADCGQAMVASLNLTRKCFDQTCDFVALTGDLPVVTSLLRLFEHDWNQINGLPAELNPRLIVGPQQGRTQLTRLLESARRHIRMTDHRLSDPRVLKVLRLQQDSGVSVEVLGDGAFPGLIPHGRMFLVDDAIAVIGSFALTPPSLDDRDRKSVV